jgi:Asp-tRNA(Asn)/Glu-tRNA(Gln) amidotransferase A subunit family amidase
LPIGIQLQAQAFAETTLLRAARILERDGGCAATLAPACA